MAQDIPVSKTSTDVSKLLQAWGTGDRAALQSLMPLVYAELRRMARRFMRMESAGHSLQPTALVHEAYFHLIDQSRADCPNRTQFLALAAAMMRRVLVDHARSKNRIKRGGNVLKVRLEENTPAAGKADWDLIALDDALTRLAELNSQHARIVELRFFGGLSIEETAKALEISPATVKRFWTTARTWLYQQMRPALPA
jgi:RNA polymerase sigma factor (TIGR02999 family)